MKKIFVPTFYYKKYCVDFIVNKIHNNKTNSKITLYNTQNSGLCKDIFKIIEECTKYENGKKYERKIKKVKYNFSIDHDKKCIQISDIFKNTKRV